VLSEHQVDAIEKILRKTAHYTVVKKNNSTSEPSNELNVTTIDNS
jgi:hypothetical protein